MIKNHLFYHVFTGYFAGCILLCLLGHSLYADASSTVRMHGTLVSQSCNLDLGDENQEIKFGSIVNTYLYEHRRSQVRKIEFHIKDCNINTIKSANISFSGTESNSLPGLLSVVGVDGIAIGIEDLAGNIVKINGVGQRWQINQQESTLSVNSYVQANPSGTENITPGSFSAVATFNIKYQ